MKKAVLILVAAFFALQSFAQGTIVKTAGITYTSGSPTWTPSTKTSSEISIDTTTGYLFQWDRLCGCWLTLGQGIDVIAGAAAPSYTPVRNNSRFVINTPTPPTTPKLYRYRTGTTWDCLNCGGGGGGTTVTTDATLQGDGDSSPLGIAQQSAVEPQFLTWTGATWEPSWGNPYIYVTSGATITSEYNEILIGTVSGDVTMGLPTCNAGLDTKHFKFVRNGADAFSVTIDPAGSQLFQDGAATKIFYGKLSIDCTCRFSGGTGTWFFDNF